MARIHSLILGALLLTTGCAEIGTISGGPEDAAAPKPIDDKCSPHNGSVNFQGNEVEITFDEFFRLHEPNINIRMVPPHAQVNTRIKGKTLYLNWQNTLQANTTYAIYLNNTVRDITENNDSIVQFVFSTGPELDTLRYTVAVADAWSGLGVKNCIVGLYDPSSGQLQSFSESDARGIATLNYLRAGEYTLVAFVDENNDLQVQEHETVAFPELSTIVLSESTSDSVPMRLFSPVKKAVRTFKPDYPGAVILSGYEIDQTRIVIDGVEQTPSDIRHLDTDSILVFVDTREDRNPKIEVLWPDAGDTLNVRPGKADRLRPVLFKPSATDNKYAPRDSVFLLCNDRITSVDTSKISVWKTADSSQILWTASYRLNALQFHLENPQAAEGVTIVLQAGAVHTVHGENARTEAKLQFPSDRKYGTLILDMSYYQEDVILFVQRGDKTIRKMTVPGGSATLRIEALDPGEYGFLVVHDDNRNGRWDVGNYADRIQPEVIDRYSTPTKVRANWDVELQLIPIAAE